MRSHETDAPGEVALDQAQREVSADAAIVPLSTYARKRQARLQAEAALLGIALYRLADGRWLASRWNLTREVADDQIEDWLRAAGGRP